MNWPSLFPPSQRNGKNGEMVQRTQKERQLRDSYAHYKELGNLLTNGHRTFTVSFTTFMYAQPRDISNQNKTKQKPTKKH